jgi:hypothetical protein
LQQALTPQELEAAQLSTISTSSTRHRFGSGALRDLLDAARRAAPYFFRTPRSASRRLRGNDDTG